MEEKSSLITQNPTDCGAHLITLISNQDQVSQSWLKFLITMESSLAVGLGFIIKPGGASVKVFTLYAMIIFMVRPEAIIKEADNWRK